MHMYIFQYMDICIYESIEMKSFGLGMFIAYIIIFIVFKIVGYGGCS